MKQRQLIAAFLILSICAALVGCTTESIVESGGGNTAANNDRSGAETSPGEERTLKVGFAISTLENAIYNRIVEGMRAASDELGVEFQVVTANDNNETQISNIENFITQGMDAIIIHAFDVEAFADVTQKALEQGIVICAYDDVIRDSATGEPLDYQLRLGVDNYNVGYEEGVLAGEWVNETYPDAESVQFGVFDYPIWEFIVARSDGAKDGLRDTAHCEVEFVATQACLYVEDGVKTGENWILAHPDMVGIIAINDGALVGFCQAWQASGRDLQDPGFGLWGVDAITDGVDLVAAGTILRGDIGLDVYNGGYDTIMNTVKVINGEPGADVIFPTFAITVDTVGEWISDPTKYSPAA